MFKVFKRGQAALEFLTTYGWAFLVILVMIGALAYFGVLSPQKFLPERCTFSPGVICKDHQLSEKNGAEFVLENGLGKTITISSMTAKVGSASLGTCSGFPASGWAAGDSMTITCANSATPVLVAGGRQKVTVDIVYTEVGGTFSHTLSGEIYAQVA